MSEQIEQEYIYEIAISSVLPDIQFSAQSSGLYRFNGRTWESALSSLPSDPIMIAAVALSPDFDVDLLVIGPFTGRNADTSVQIQMKLRPTFPVDLLVRISEKVRERIAMGDTFMQEILTQGKVLYKTVDG